MGPWSCSSAISRPGDVLAGTHDNGVCSLSPPRGTVARAMRLRLFGLVIAAALLGAPTAARAQGAQKVARIGWLSPASAGTGSSNFDALRSGLRELGYVEGRNLVFEKRWADGVAARMSA